MAGKNGKPVATGDVVLVAKFPGVKKDIENAIGEPTEKITKATGKKGGLLFSGVWKRTIKTAGLGAALVAGMAIKGGWSRAMQKEQAVAALKGLGHSVKGVNLIMKNALASVKGTAFGLGEASSVAASAVAAGVKPGKDLERTLKLTGDAATIAGISMGEMGAIFNKVAASNKLQMDTVNQLNDRGVPILSMVARKLGVTQEQAAKMASQGKISFDVFRDAMEAGLGGAALKSGNTTIGALKNLKAALSRLGEAFLGVGVSSVKGFAKSLTGVVDAITARVKPVLETIVPLIKNYGPAFLSVVAPVASFLASFNMITTVVTKVRALTTATKGVFTLIKANPTVAIIAGIVAAGVALYTLYQRSETFRNMVNAVWGALKSFWQGLGPVGQAVLTFGAGIGTLIAVLTSAKTMMLAVTVAQKLMNTWTLIVKAATVAWTGVQAVFNAVMDANPISLIIIGIAALVAAIIYAWRNSKTFRDTVIGAWNAIKNAVMVVYNWFATSVVPALQAVWDGICAGVTWVGSVFSAVWNTIVTVFNFAWSVITTIVTTYINVVWTIVSTVFTTVYNYFVSVWGVIRTVVTTVWSAIKTTVTVTIGVVRSVITSALSGVSAVFRTVWGTIKSIVISVWATIKSVVVGAINTVRSVISSVMGTVRYVWSAAWGSIRSVIGGAWSAIRSAVVGGIRSVVSTVRGLPGRVVGALGNLGHRLYASGRALINGFTNGIKSAFRSAKQWVSNGLASIRSLFPFSPAREGPFSGRGWVAYSGESIGKTFSGSLIDSLHHGVSPVSRVLGQYRSVFDAQSYEASASFSARARLRTDNTGFGDVGGGRVVAPTFTINSNDGEQVARMVARRMMGVVA